MSGQRFEVRPSGVFAGRYMVVDVETGVVARHGARVCTRLDQPAAAELCERLNTKARRRKVCRACRHLAPADTIIDGRCQTCAA